MAGVTEAEAKEFIEAMENVMRESGISHSYFGSALRETDASDIDIAILSQSLSPLDDFLSTPSLRGMPFVKADQEELDSGKYTFDTDIEKVDTYLWEGNPSLKIDLVYVKNGFFLHRTDFYEHNLQLSVVKNTFGYDIRGFMEVVLQPLPSPSRKLRVNPVCLGSIQRIQDPELKSRMAMKLLARYEKALARGYSISDDTYESRLKEMILLA